MNNKFLRMGMLPVSLLGVLPAFAATTIDLSHQPVSTLTSLMASPSAAASAMKMEEVNRSSDFNQTLHIRVRQTYQGYPVWGGDGIVHVPHASQTNLALMKTITPASSMNGKIYANLQADLAATPSYVFSQVQAQKAAAAAIAAYQQQVGAKPAIKNLQSHLIVYIDENSKAHWAYQTRFFAGPVKAHATPEKPVTILDAVSFRIYKKWNDLKTLDDSAGGGLGGNKKMGPISYDGMSGHLPKLNVERDAASNTCYLKNNDVTVKDARQSGWPVMSYSCSKADAAHNGVYWNGQSDAIHGAYSPSNDALYAGAVIKDMYHKWYQQEVLMKDKKPMMLNMVVHEDMDNAYWDDDTGQMVFGDGQIMFYPLTSLGVGAHEISHGFTSQHSNLVYDGQSGGMNEAFSDMAAQAAEYYSYGKNSWQIGPEIVYFTMMMGDALRYMDQPSRDCGWWPTGWRCSIDKASQYSFGMDPHFSSGVYNRVFYLIGTSPGWNTKKAFDIMVQANMHYWTPSSTYFEGACGVMKAAKDYNYDTATVEKAFKMVDVDTTKC